MHGSTCGGEPAQQTQPRLPSCKSMDSARGSHAASSSARSGCARKTWGQQSGMMRRGGGAWREADVGSASAEEGGAAQCGYIGCHVGHTTQMKVVLAAGHEKSVSGPVACGATLHWHTGHVGKWAGPGAGSSRPSNHGGVDGAAPGRGDPVDWHVAMAQRSGRRKRGVIPRGIIRRRVRHVLLSRLQGE